MRDKFFNAPRESIRLTAMVTVMAMSLAAACDWGHSRSDSIRLTASPTGRDSYFFDNGLSPDARATFYRLAEGSEILPLPWLAALDNFETGEPFLRNAERFGFIPNPYSADNHPIGLSVGRPRNAPIPGEWVGLNCAACHVGQISHAGKSYIIDGAPNLFDIEAFYDELARTALRTATDARELWGWLRRMVRGRDSAPSSVARHPETIALTAEGDSPAIELEEFLEKSFDELEGGSESEREFATSLAKELRRESMRPAAERQERPEADSFSNALNLESARLRAASDLETSTQLSPRTRDALAEIMAWQRLLYGRYVQLRALADSGGVESTPGGPGRTDAFGRARNAIFGAVHGSSYEPEPITAPVSYPSLWGFPKVEWLHWNGNTTSTLTRNIGQAIGVGAIFVPRTYESTVQLANLKQLEQLARLMTAPAWPFGIDTELAKNGREIYEGEGRCASCHDGAERIFSIDTTEANGGIETDPLHAHNFDKPVDDRPFYEALRVELERTKDWLVAAERTSALGDDNTPELWRSTRGYPGRELAGIWASPPYLHNGSVPTLQDLLSPPKERPEVFSLGSRDYDPERVGYVISSPSHTFQVDTRLPGNSNSGHNFGTQLTNEQRRALLEYLKTL